MDRKRAVGILAVIPTLMLLAMLVSTAYARIYWAKIPNNDTDGEGGSSICIVCTVDAWGTKCISWPCHKIDKESIKKQQ